VAKLSGSLRIGCTIQLDNIDTIAHAPCSPKWACLHTSALSRNSTMDHTKFVEFYYILSPFCWGEKIECNKSIEHTDFLFLTWLHEKLHQKTI
jgi:hypothetical protein